MPLSSPFPLLNCLGTRDYTARSAMSILAQYGIDPSGYDLAIIVSSAGEIDAATGGASTLLLDEATDSRIRLDGGATKVDVRFMDVMGVIAALQYHDQKLAQAGKRYRALVLTENYQLVQEAGQPHEGYEWAALDWFAQKRYDLAWQWESTTKRQPERQAAKAVRRAFRNATEWAS